MSSRADDGGTRALGDRVRGRLRRLADRMSNEVTEERWAFRRAAALLLTFDPVHLAPAGGNGRIGGAVLALIDDCVALGTPAHRFWTLRPEVRTATLQRMTHARQARAALDANPECTKDGVERIVRDLLDGEEIDLNRQSLDQLSETFTAVSWLSHLHGLPNLPALDNVVAAQQRQLLYEPLETLVGDTFHGREAELTELRAFVGVLAPNTTLAARLRGGGRPVRRRRSPQPEPPLMVWGPGGIGKSTLLAKFLLDHTRAHADLRSPFVYLDFERATLNVAEPALLIAEAARQLAMQREPGAIDSATSERPDSPQVGPTDAVPTDAASDGPAPDDSVPDRDAPTFADVQADAAREASRQRSEQVELDQLERLSASKATIHRDLSQALRSESMVQERRLMERLIASLRSTAPPGHRDDGTEPPLLIVLDSFEEAQYRGSPDLLRLMAVFEAAQRVYPGVRVVVSGRAPVEELAINQRSTRYLPLHDFDIDAAVGFLRAHGIADQEAGRAIATRFGGNPLVLKLAARVARDAGPDTEWINDVRTRRWLFASTEASLIQSQLYQRILGSLRDEDLRKLAHPGLVLRRITPDLIKDVLAEPCDVDVPTLERATELLDELARKVDLVTRVGPETLVHRPDVRQGMLRLLEADRPETVESIERRAVAYYHHIDGPAARAEEIYHRLRLGENPRAVEQRWIPGVGQYLDGDTQDELPARARSFVAAKLSGVVTPEVLEEADLADWEVLTAREVENLLDQTGDDTAQREHARAALHLTAVRTARTPGSPLYRLEAEALARVGRLRDAERTVQEGIASVQDQRAPRGIEVRRRLLDLLLLGARLLLDEGQAQLADRELATAEMVADQLRAELDALGTLVLRIRLRPAGDHELDGLRQRAAKRFLDLSDAALRRQPALIRSIVELIGEAQPDVLWRAIDLLGLRHPEAREVDALTEALLALTDDRPDAELWLREIAVLRGVHARNLRAEVRSLIERLASTDRLVEVAQVLVANSDNRPEFRRLLIRMLPASATTVLATKLAAAPVAPAAPHDAGAPRLPATQDTGDTVESPESPDATEAQPDRAPRRT